MWATTYTRYVSARPIGSVCQGRFLTALRICNLFTIKLMAERKKARTLHYGRRGLVVDSEFSINDYFASICARR
jgi:hypothetical protein